MGIRSDLENNFDFEIIETNSGLSLVEDILKNKITITNISGTYYQQVWNDTGTDVLFQWQLYDKDGLDVVLTGRGPASRSIPSGV